MAQELYRHTVRETDDFSILSAISDNSLFGETDFYKDGRKIVVTREATSFPARPFEKNQQMIPDSQSPEQFTVCAGKMSYKLAKFDEFTMEEMKGKPQLFAWLIDLIEKMHSNVVAETYFPDLIAGMRVEASSKTKGTQAGGVLHKYNLGTPLQPRIIKLNDAGGENSYFRFVMDLQELLEDLDQFRSNEMFIFGDSRIKNNITSTAAQTMQANKLLDSPIFSASGNEIGNKMLNFNFLHHKIMRPSSVNNQKVYPILFGWNKAYAYGAHTHHFQTGGAADLRTTDVYIRAMFMHGGRVVNPDALGVAYITFQQ